MHVVSFGNSWVFIKILFSIYTGNCCFIAQGFWNLDVCVCFINPLLFPTRRVKTRALKLWMQLGQADFTDWISFLPYNLAEEISPNPDALREIW